MKKIIFYSFIIFSLSISAQNQDITSAIISFQKNDFTNAKVAIDKATDKIDGGAILKAKKMAKYYHYKGLIYFRQFQIDSLHDSREFFLDVATEALLKDANLNSSFSKKSINQLNMCINGYSFLAGEYYQRKEYALALKNFTSAIAIQQSSFLNNIDLNTIYSAALSAKYAEIYPDAIKWFSKLVEIAPDSTSSHLELIRTYEDSGDLEAQLQAINNARLMIPQSQAIIIEEVNYYLDIGDNESLLKSLDFAVQKDSTNAVLHFVLGLTYSNLGQQDKAINSYKKSISLDPNSVDAYNNLAAIYIDEAIGYEEQYNNLPINASQKKYDTLSKKLKNSQLKALPYLEKILSLKPDDDNIANRLKQIYYQLGMQDKSMSMKKLIELQGEERASFVKDYFSN